VSSRADGVFIKGLFLSTRADNQTGDKNEVGISQLERQAKLPLNEDCEAIRVFISMLDACN
jgi:hypothetical protein